MRVSVGEISEVRRVIRLSLGRVNATVDVNRGSNRSRSFSTARQCFAAKLRNAEKRCANPSDSAQLRKTRCAMSRKTAQKLVRQLQISRSGPAELCRRFPR